MQETPINQNIESKQEGKFYQAAWRWHFYAGIFVTPFLIILAITGMTMMFITNIDGRDGEKITVLVPANEKRVSLDKQIDTAFTAYPKAQMAEWIKGEDKTRVNIFRLKKEDKTFMMVAVNPYTNTIVEDWQRRQGLYDFAEDIHSNLLLGKTGDRILEIAAGFSIVLIITGAYLWWPRNRKFSLPLVPNFTLKGRDFVIQLHASVGMYVSVFFLLFLLSGMTWTGIWGGKFVQAWSTFPAQKWSDVPLSDKTHASLDTSSSQSMPWALEQTKLPASGSNKGTTGTLHNEKINLDSISSLAKRIGYEGRYRVSFPKGELGVWTINQDTIDGDAQNPFSDKTVHVDRYTGKVLAKVTFDDYSLAGKTMAVSIPLHMGLVTIWNVILNTLVCLSIITLGVSGVIMWWKRRPKNSGFTLSAPKAPSKLAHWHNAMIIMLVLSLAFPLVGITLISVLILDTLILSRIPALKKVFN